MQRNLLFFLIFLIFFTTITFASSNSFNELPSQEGISPIQILSQNIFIYYIFPYLFLDELENFQFFSKNFEELYKNYKIEILNVEKWFLQRCLQNEASFLGNKNKPTYYFDIFEKKNSKHYTEYVPWNKNTFSENLDIRPKGLRQSIVLSIDGVKYKFLLLKDGRLFSFEKYKQNEYKKVNFTCQGNNFRFLTFRLNLDYCCARRGRLAIKYDVFCRKKGQVTQKIFTKCGKEEKIYFSVIDKIKQFFFVFKIKGLIVYLKKTRFFFALFVNFQLNL